MLLSYSSHSVRERILPLAATKAAEPNCQPKSPVPKPASRGATSPAGHSADESGCPHLHAHGCHHQRHFSHHPTGEIVFSAIFSPSSRCWPILRDSRAYPVEDSQAWGHVARGLAGVSAMFLLFPVLLPAPRCPTRLRSASRGRSSLPFCLSRCWVRRSAGGAGRRPSSVRGVLVMTRPGAGVFEIAALVPLLGAVFTRSPWCRSAGSATPSPRPRSCSTSRPLRPALGSAPSPSVIWASIALGGFCRTTSATGVSCF